MAGVYKGNLIELGMEEGDFHQPVLLKEAIENLNVQPGKRYIDATVGGGGHTREILKKGGVVLGLDRDPEAISRLKTQLKKDAIRNRYVHKERDKKLIVVRGNFKNLKQIAQKHSFDKLAGILFDLGLSSWQIEKSGRGFSYLRDERLDMRMDPNQNLKAADLVNRLKEEELDEIFTKFGEEVNSRAIARAIVRARPIKTTQQLAKAVEGNYRQLARVFQALRIVVNDELRCLKLALPQAVELLEKGGRLVVISFHSLEDRMVKFAFKTKDLKIITKKPIRPSKEETAVNPRSSSARLRVAERI